LKYKLETADFREMHLNEKTGKKLEIYTTKMSGLCTADESRVDPGYKPGPGHRLGAKAISTGFLLFTYCIIYV